MRRSMLMLSLLSLAVPMAHAAPAPASPAVPAARVTVVTRPALRVGLSAYAGELRAAADAANLKGFLEARLGRDVVIKTYDAKDALSVALADGEVDIAWLQPLSYVMAERLEKGIRPLAKVERKGMPFYRGVLFTRADKAVAGVEGLRGLSMAWTEKGSAAGFLFPRAALLRSGVQLAGFFRSERMMGDHAAVCRAVASGEADVGATYADERGKALQADGCVQALGAEAAAQLKIVLKSAAIPNDLVAARAGMDAAEAAELSKLLLSLGKAADEKTLLEQVFHADRFVEVGPDDFEPVRFAAAGMSL